MLDESQAQAQARAVVLLSGGLDSVTTLAIARSRGFAVHALTVSYGQRHEVEHRKKVGLFRAGIADAQHPGCLHQRQEHHAGGAKMPLP